MCTWFVCMLSGSQSECIGAIRTVSGYFERFILQQFPLATHVLATMKTCLPHSSVSNTHLPRCISLHILYVRTCMAWVCNFACKNGVPLYFVPFKRMHFYCGICTSYANSSGLLAFLVSVYSWQLPSPCVFVGRVDSSAIEGWLSSSNVYNYIVPVATHETDHLLVVLSSPVHSYGTYHLPFTLDWRDPVPTYSSICVIQ